MSDKKALQTIYVDDHWEMFISMKHRQLPANYPLNNITTITKPISTLADIIANPTYQLFTAREINAKRYLTEKSREGRYSSRAALFPYHDRGYHTVQGIYIIGSCITFLGLIIGFLKSIIDNKTTEFTLGTAIPGFILAGLGALIMLGTNITNTCITDRTKRRLKQFDNLLEEKERLENIIPIEIALKEETIQACIDILARQEDNQLSKKAILSSYYRYFAESMDQFDDVNAYEDIKNTIQIIKVNQLIDKDKADYLTIILAQIKMKIFAKNYRKYSAYFDINFMTNFNQSNTIYSLLTTTDHINDNNIQVIFKISIFKELAKLLKNNSRLAVFSQLVKLKAIDLNITSDNYESSLLKYLSDDLVVNEDYNALVNNLNQIIDDPEREEQWINTIKNNLYISNNQLTTLSDLLKIMQLHREDKWLINDILLILSSNSEQLDVKNKMSMKK